MRRKTDIIRLLKNINDNYEFIEGSVKQRQNFGKTLMAVVFQRVYIKRFRHISLSAAFVALFSNPDMK